MGFIHLSYGQDFATIINNTDCDLRITVNYVDNDCVDRGGVATNTVQAGGTWVAPFASSSNHQFITSASITRVISNSKGAPFICAPTVFVSPPPICHSCQGTWPQIINFAHDGDCCGQPITGTWSELSCSGTGQTTELVFN